MLKAKTENRKQIKDLRTDLEVINPIETKTILGGDWYDGAIVYNNYHNQGGYDSWGSSSWGSDWDNNDPYHEGLGGGEPNQDSGGGNTDNGYGELLENPSLEEISWLFNNVSFQELALMIDNKNFALEKAAPIPGASTNGLGDAFRHALWSAADAADIGLQKATQFHTLHETANPVTDGSNQMDLFNNNWGFNWFSQNGDPVSNMTQFISDFNNAVANGQIQTKP